MKKYKVTGYTKPKYKHYMDDFSIELAKELFQQYGLYQFTLDEIHLIWSRYSEDYFSAGWLSPSKENVEKAFGVVLEELEDGT